MKMKLTTRDIGMLVLLAIILVAVLYYMGFYKPLQADLAEISDQTIQTDDNIQLALTKVENMKKMQVELNEILSQPKFQITEIAPYDNKDVVLNMLNGVLGSSEKYSLSFTDPTVSDQGTVRRDISMNFTCRDYASAKVILRNLSKSNWRCLVRNVSITSESGATLRKEDNNITMVRKDDEKIDAEDYDDKDIMMNPVSVTATITFFESTKLTAEG